VGVVGEGPQGIRISPGRVVHNIRHRTYESAARIVVMQHHSDGTVVVRKADSLHANEEHVFFLGVMALVRKGSDEVDGLGRSL
jgi:hypothetical protein